MYRLAFGHVIDSLASAVGVARTSMLLLLQSCHIASESNCCIFISPKHEMITADTSTDHMPS